MEIAIKDLLTVFIVLFAIIDITGSIPIILDIKNKCGGIQPLRTTLVALVFMIVFLLIGEPMLKLFGVDVSSFAIAGSFVVLFIALEMILGIEFFKYETHKSSSIVPIAFPLIAGAGSFTTLLSLKSQYNLLTIIIALLLNMVIVFVVLRSTQFFERMIGQGGIYVLKRMFGVILLAIAIKLFISNTGIQLGNAV